MQQATALTAPGEFAPLPRTPAMPADDEVQIAVRACGLCDTDARMSANPPPFMQLPLVLGHQVVGDVLQTGSSVEHLAVGDRVVVTFLLGCGECHFCRTGRDSQCQNARFLGVHTDGGLGETVTVPARFATPLPKQADPAVASLIGCGYATPYRALIQAGLQGGESVLLIGDSLWVLAAIDLCAAMGVTALVATGNSAFADRFAKRAQALGATAVFGGDPQALPEWLGQQGRDGSPPVETIIDFEADATTTPAAMAALPPGGTLVYVGHADTQGAASVAFPGLQFTEITVSGCCLIRHQEVVTLSEWFAAGRLHADTLVEKRIPPAADAIAMALDEIRQRPAAGIVVEFS